MLTRVVCVALIGVAFLLGQWAVAGTPADKPPKKDAAKTAEKAKLPATLAPAEKTPKKKAAARAEPKGAPQLSPPASPAAKKESVKKGDASVRDSDAKPAPTPKSRGTVPLPASQSRAAAEAAIRRALDKPISLEFVETPLHDVVEYLKDCLQIRIVLHLKALSDVGVAADTPITRNLLSISARSALNLLLDDLDLTWVISNEVLLITTRDEAGSMLENVVYEVHDLVAARDEKGVPVNDFDQLIAVITSTIAPTTWDQVGGAGSIAPFEGNGITALSISQTQRVHEQIAKLLADLRKATHAKPGEPLHIRTIRSASNRMGACSILGNPPSQSKPADSQPTPSKEQPKPTGGGQAGGMGGGKGMY